MSSTTTCQPSATNAATTARPSAPVPPVISAVRSTRCTLSRRVSPDAAQRSTKRHSSRRGGIPSDGGSTFRPMVVRQLTDGQEFDCILLVRARELRTKRDGVGLPLPLRGAPGGAAHGGGGVGSPRRAGGPPPGPLGGVLGEGAPSLP